MIHEQLYRSQNPLGFRMAEYVNTLVRRLAQSYHVEPYKVGLRIDVPDIKLDIDTVIPLGLIINELVSNALKYAFPNGGRGELRIQLRERTEKRYTLLISDNGIGMPADLDIENTKSLGLRIVLSLVSQLEGQLEILRHKGTEFKINFQDQSFSTTAARKALD